MMASFKCILGVLSCIGASIGGAVQLILLGQGADYPAIRAGAVGICFLVLTLGGLNVHSGIVEEFPAK
jgi:hypothetical protein